MEISRCVEDKNAAQDKQSTSSGQEKSHGMEAPSVERSMMYDRSEDMEIDIIGCTDNCEGGPSSECNDSTENSSSFGDTVSGTDYGSLLDDEEVESQLYDDNNLQPISNGCREVFPRYTYIFSFSFPKCFNYLFVFPHVFSILNFVLLVDE